MSRETRLALLVLSMVLGLGWIGATILLSHFAPSALVLVGLVGCVAVPTPMAFVIADVMFERNEP